MGSGWWTFFNNLPFLLNCNLLNKSCLLINFDFSNNCNLCVMKLWNVNVMFVCWKNLFDHCIVDLWNANNVLNCDSILRNIDISYLRKINGMLHSSAFKSIDRSLHWKNKGLHINLIKHNECNLWNVDCSLIGRNVLFQMNKSYLGNLNWMLNCGDYLLDHNESDLRDFNWMFKCRNNLFNADEMDLRKFNWEFLCLSLGDLNSLDFCRRGRRREHNNFFNDDRSWRRNDYSWLFNHFNHFDRLRSQSHRGRSNKFDRFSYLNYFWSC